MAQETNDNVCLQHALVSDSGIIHHSSGLDLVTDIDWWAAS